MKVDSVILDFQISDFLCCFSIVVSISTLATDTDSLPWHHILNRVSKQTKKHDLMLQEFRLTQINTESQFTRLPAPSRLLCNCSLIRTDFPTRSLVAFRLLAHCDLNSLRLARFSSRQVTYCDARSRFDKDSGLIEFFDRSSAAHREVINRQLNFFNCLFFGRSFVTEMRRCETVCIKVGKCLFSSSDEKISSKKLQLSEKKSRL